MAEPLRHRQTKEAATDMFSLQPPRYIPTLPDSEPPTAGPASPLTLCGAFGGYETEIPHQLAGVLKARQIADLGQHRHCRDEIYPAHRLQGCDELGKGPLGHRVTDRLLQTLDTLALLAYRPQKLFERNTLLAMLELLQHEPIHVGRPPRLLARIMSPEPKHERGDLLALAFEVFPRCLTGAREIAHPSCRSSGTQTAVSSPARNSLARPTASRRFVFTRSPGFFGMSERAATMKSWTRATSAATSLPGLRRPVR